MSEITSLGSSNKTYNVPLMELKMENVFLVSGGQYLIFWCHYIFNIYTPVGIIIFLTVGDVSVMSLGIIERTYIAYLSNT